MDTRRGTKDIKDEQIPRTKTMPLSTHSSSSIWNEFAPIYDEMRSRNHAAIVQAKALREDGFFRDARDRKDDDRRCLAISAIIDETVLSAKWTPAFQNLQSVLHHEFPKDLHFGQKVEPGRVDGQLHWTIMQLVGFGDYETECIQGQAFQQDEYLNCVEDSLRAGGLDSQLTIKYVGVIAVATGLLMIGVPSMDTNKVRERLRSRLTARSLPLREPFVNNIVHSTLFRVTSGQDTDTNLYSRLLEIAEEFETTDLGEVILNKFQIGPASWRMLHSEVEATPPWRTWKLSDVTASQAYLNRMASDGIHRSIQTFSGTTGASLAAELKSTLEKRGLQHGTPNDSNIADTQNEKKKLDGEFARPLTNDKENSKSSTYSGSTGSALAAQLRSVLENDQGSSKG